MVDAQMPGEVKYGFVYGKTLLAVGDTTRDGDRFPDPIPAQGTVTFTPVAPVLRATGDDPATIVPQPIVCEIHRGAGDPENPDPSLGGLLVDPAGHVGNVALIVGQYSVSYQLDGRVSIKPFTISVLPEHTEEEPLLLAAAAPLVPQPSVKFVVNEQIYLEATAARDEAVAAGAGVAASADAAVAAAAEAAADASEARESASRALDSEGAAAVSASEASASEGAAKVSQTAAADSAAAAAASAGAAAASEVAARAHETAAAGSAGAAQASADEVQAMVDAGTPGPQGPAATVTVDSVSTGVAGSSATVENVGTSSAAKLRFTIPRGDKGAPGHTPEFSWDGSVLKIDGTPGPDLRGPVGEGAVASVNGKSGEVVLTAADVGARPAGNVTWGEVTGKPSTFPPATHSHTAADVGARPAGNVPWAEVSGKPTILTTANVNSLINAALGPVGDVLDAILDGVN